VCKILISETEWKRKMRSAYTILVGKPEGRDNSEDLGVDGDRIKMIYEIVDWIKAAEDRYKLQAFVSTVMDLWSFI
jgi:hypothetical protein